MRSCTHKLQMRGCLHISMGKMKKFWVYCSFFILVFCWLHLTFFCVNAFRSLKNSNWWGWHCGLQKKCCLQCQSSVWVLVWFLAAAPLPVLALWLRARDSLVGGPLCLCERLRSHWLWPNPALRSGRSLSALPCLWNSTFQIKTNL